MSSFALKASRRALDSGVEGAAPHFFFSITSRRWGQPLIRKSIVTKICSSLTETSRISSESLSKPFPPFYFYLELVLQ